MKITIYSILIVGIIVVILGSFSVFQIRDVQKALAACPGTISQSGVLTASLTTDAAATGETLNVTINATADLAQAREIAVGFKAVLIGLPANAVAHPVEMYQSSYMPLSLSDTGGSVTLDWKIPGLPSGTYQITPDLPEQSGAIGAQHFTVFPVPLQIQSLVSDSAWATTSGVAVSTDSNKQVTIPVQNTSNAAISLSGTFSLYEGGQVSTIGSIATTKTDAVTVPAQGTGVILVSFPVDITGLYNPIIAGEVTSSDFSQNFTTQLGGASDNVTLLSGTVENSGKVVKTTTTSVCLDDSNGALVNDTHADIVLKNQDGSQLSLQSINSFGEADGGLSVQYVHKVIFSHLPTRVEVRLYKGAHLLDILNNYSL